MDPIEIFELSGYVVQASAVNAELAVNATELRPYVVQKATAQNVEVVSELRLYAIQGGAPASGTAINSIVGYIVASDGTSVHLNENNTIRNGFRYRNAGVSLPSMSSYSIEPDTNSLALKSTVRLQNPGVKHLSTHVYTVEIP